MSSNTDLSKGSSNQMNKLKNIVKQRSLDSLRKVASPDAKSADSSPGSSSPSPRSARPQGPRLNPFNESSKGDSLPLAGESANVNDAIQMEGGVFSMADRSRSSRPPGTSDSNESVIN